MEKSVKKTADTGKELPERRRKMDGNKRPSRQRLAIPPKLADNKEFTYRWATDADARLQTLVGEDWDFAKLEGSSTNKTGAHKVHTGTLKDGSPQYQYLLRKPVKYYHEDKAAEQSAIDERMKQVKREAENPTGVAEYKPASVNVEMG